MSANSFWAKEGALPNDVIKAINGTEITLQNANAMLQEANQWKEGKIIEVKLLRDGKEVIISTETSQPFTTGDKLKPNPEASKKQLDLRKAWLKG